MRGDTGMAARTFELDVAGRARQQQRKMPARGVAQHAQAINVEFQA